VLDDLQGIVLVKENNRIDKAQSGKEFSPFILGLDGPVLALDGFYGSVGVHRDDEIVPQLPGGIEVASVPGMEEIKAAVCENDLLSLSLELFDLFLEVGEVFDLLSVFFHGSHLGE
jgi:hypothetical protein